LFIFLSDFSASPGLAWVCTGARFGGASRYFS